VLLRSSLTPAHVLGAAVRRYSLACTHHAGMQPEADFRALKQAMQNLRWEEAELHWCETTRRSRRQGTLMRLGGMIGQARLDLAPAPRALAVSLICPVAALG
jgi:hypothetical protein